MKAARPWYKKKRFIIPAGVVPLFIAIGMTGGGDDESVASGSDRTRETVEATSDADSSAAAEAAESAAAEEAERAAAEEAARVEAERVAAEQAAAEEAAAAAAEAALLDRAAYSAISARDWALLERDPDAHAGEKYVLHGYVTQFDAMTGTEMFRANTSGEKFSDWYDYEINTIVTLSDPAIGSNVVVDDLVTMYVEVIGAYSYETTIGGSMTVPLVMAYIVDVTGTA